MPFGAEYDAGHGTRFRLWAPAARSVLVELAQDGAPRNVPLAARDDGWFEAIVADARPGARYAFRIDGRDPVPDPASRANPDDVHGASAVVDPQGYAWQDGAWRGRPWSDAVLYELHVGTFTPGGTFGSAIERLDALVDLGVTALEIMPVADFPGTRNWGYDGVLPFAPDASYGAPDDLKRLVDAAHARDLMILLDVVYNHFGPEGNYLHAYAPAFFNPAHRTPWGAAINFDGPGSRHVRDYFIHNALYWLEEYHFDGLRFDAVHAIADDSSPHIVAELTETVRARLGTDRYVHLVLENDANEARYLDRDASGRPRHATAQWNDDLHHVVHALVTSEHDGYYADYVDDPLAQLGRALAEGFVYQGQRSAYRQAPRGEASAHLPPGAFVNFLQNHDQVGNRAFGERLSTLCPPERLRASIALLLLAPAPPMLFMGEEFAASSPFLFFCDFHGDLAAAVSKGRREEFKRFARFADPALRERIPDPNARTTFEASKLDWSEVEQPAHRAWLDFHRACLAARREHLAPRLGRMRTGGTFETIGDSGLAVRWLLGDGARWTLVANLGDQALTLDQAPHGRCVFRSDMPDARAISPSVPPWTVTATLGAAAR
jgi:maltooligosyltrehalose trehalohydrolase